MKTQTPSISEPSPSTGSRWKRDAFRLLIACLLCLLVPPLVLQGDPDVPNETEGEERIGAGESIKVSKVIADLRAAQPDYVGIGNSMLYTRLGKSPDQMSALSGRKFSLISRGGSNVTVWYLALKNLVVASGIRPKAVFLFVRDDELTAPYFAKNEATAAAYLRSLRGAEEPVLDKFMGINNDASSAASQADQWLTQVYSFDEWQEYLSRRLMGVAMEMGGVGTPQKAQRFALSARFGLDHLRGNLAADENAAPALGQISGGFQQTLEASLLPDMLRLSAECGAKLVVFRVKRRPDAKTHLPNEPSAMPAYADFLKKWLEARGGLFFDETYDTSIRLSDYLDLDHIRPERMEWYQQYFWERMKGVLP